MPGFLDPVTLLGYFGPWALAGLLLALAVESGILFPLLPGDSLLFVAGMVIAAGGKDGVPAFASLWQVLLLAPIAAIVGAEIGFVIGDTVGTRWFGPDNRILKRRYVDEAHAFFDRHGPVTILLARFVPVVRTITPIIAGAAKMKHRNFLIYNVIGAVSWTAGVTMLGYWLGRVSFVQQLIEPIFVLIVAASVIPMIVAANNRRRTARTVPTADTHDDSAISS
ncbi:VTT domain-containing protein [uncultured Gordonia sp.]|uniref:VTT domain-containing protein n=1 Tax=uncultured Gordonia sp. TaxID=198437 RepID=UPI0025923680|nr:VTT domain-containing protein [uncultured Gordonia sp.]